MKKNCVNYLNKFNFYCSRKNHTKLVKTKKIFTL